jgi:hypothetical protein
MTTHAPSTQNSAKRTAPASTYRPRVLLTRTYGVYQVESEKRPGVTYRTDAVLGTCDCPAGVYNRACKHVALAVRVWEMHHALRLAARQRSVTVTPHVEGASTTAPDAPLAEAERRLTSAHHALADTDPRDDSYAVLLRAVDQAERTVAALSSSALRAA